MQVQIKFIARGSAAACGNFAPGDLLRCGQEVARHLVTECRAAVYVQEAAAANDLPLAVPAIETPADTIAAVCSGSGQADLLDALPAPRRNRRA